MSELAIEFKVACQIYAFNVKNEPVWFTKLTETLKLPPKEIMCGLRALFDWGIVKGEYGETSKGQAGRCLYITSESKRTIKEVHDTYFITQQTKDTKP